MNPIDQVITVAEAVERSGFNVRRIQRLCKKWEEVGCARQDHKSNWLILKSIVPTKEEVFSEIKSSM